MTSGRAARSAPIGVLATAAVALCAATVAFSLVAAPADDRALAAVVQGLVVAVPAGVALATLRRRPGDRFALLLLASALLGSLTTATVSDDSVSYSIGRIAVWLVEPALVYLLLAFPSGRLTGARDRIAFGALIAVDALLYLPSVLVVEHFPEPSPWGMCGDACPPNAFAVTGTEPAFAGDIVQPLREGLTAVIYLAVAVLIAGRMRRSAPLGRRALAPVLGTAVFRAVALAAYDIARSGGETSALLTALGWVYALTLPLIALGFAGGLLLARLYGAGALERLTRRLHASATATELRVEMAEAFEDPALQIAYRAPDEPEQWVSDAGRPVPAPTARPGRVITEVRASGRVAAIDHDAALALEPGIVQAAATYAAALLENSRLVAELQVSLRELAESRGRILSVGVQARRRIERDLHDGAQQRLVALRTYLALESDRLRDRSASIADTLAKLGDDVEETIDEVRSIARGIYPSLLADGGLDEALRAAALGAPIPARVDSDGVGRYGPEIETTIYFACVEALQNAVKHGHGATGVWISLSDTGSLRFEVRDDGVGFSEPVTPGAGLTNIRDRLAALGGLVTIESTPGEGTRVAGIVPVNGTPVNGTPVAGPPPAPVADRRNGQT
jgi:signal transduction histidine kinase